MSAALTQRVRKAGCEALVNDIVGRFARSVVQELPRCWAVKLGPHRPTGSLRLEQNWLVYDEPVQETSSLGSHWAWHLLRLQRSLPSRCRYILAEGESVARLQSDLWLPRSRPHVIGVADVCLENWFADIECANSAATSPLSESHEPVESGSSGEPVKADNPVGPAESAEALGPGDASLAALCTEAGWPPIVRASGGVQVDVGSRTPGQRADVCAVEDGVQLCVICLDEAEIPDVDPCRDALAIFSLRAAGAVRLVRPVLDRDFAFEVRLCDPVTAADLDRGLGALTVAVDLFRDEARVLARHAELAAPYIEIQAPLDS